MTDYLTPHERLSALYEKRDWKTTLIKGLVGIAAVLGLGLWLYLMVITLVVLTHLGRPL